MSYDIYGEPLRRGHCEVHPHVHEEYPCSVCMTESRRQQEAQAPVVFGGSTAHCESAHYLGQAQEEIERLNEEIQELRKDAERYKAVRSGFETTTTNWLGKELIGEEMDAYVDRIRFCSRYAEWSSRNE